MFAATGSFFERAENSLLDFLRLWIPLPCPLCGKGVPFDGTANMFCADCMARMPLIRGQVCPSCGAELDGIFSSCTDCMNSPKPLWKRAYSIFKYRESVMDCVHQLKYKGGTELARPLGRLAAGLFDQDSPHYDFIVPIPLHWTRYLSRGYNQSELFARQVSLHTGIPLKRALKRIRPTKQQAFLSKSERKSNIKGAFSVFDSTVAEKRTILLTDDVMTTGSTLREAAGVLLKAGADRVDILVIARRQRN